MLGDSVNQTEQPSMEQVSSPLSAQILEFCESDLFQNSEVASSSNCCYDEQSSYDIIKYPTPIDTNLIFDEEANLDLTNLQFGQEEQCDLALLQNQLSLHNNGSLPNEPLIGPTMPKDDSLPPSKFMRFNNPNCLFMDATINSYLSGNLNPPLPLENPGIFNGNLFLEFKGDNGGMFCPDPLYNSNELGAHSNDLVNGNGSCTATPEITSLEAETFKAANKLSSEERKEKIHRYMKKRNERNFSKKIKYACRKTLADSRPRVRGRFAKNDEFGENNNNRSNHEEDTDEEVKSFHVVVKEEEENFESSSDIFAHISGVNSFKCNYPIQSWI